MLKFLAILVEFGAFSPWHVFMPLVLSLGESSWQELWTEASSDTPPT